MSELQQNPMGVQLEASLFARLVMAGHMDECLTIQHCMVPQICKLVSNVFYDGHLQNAESVCAVQDKFRKMMSINSYIKIAAYGSPAVRVPFKSFL